MQLRPSSAQDRPAVLALLAARDQADIGEADFTAPFVIDEWRSREFDPGRDAVVVQDADEVVGYAASFTPGDLALVHPDREGEGVGTQLLRWLEGGAPRREVFRQRVTATNHVGRAFLDGAGYHVVRSVHYLGWTGDPSAALAPPPEGVTLEAIDPDRDGRTLHELDALAFGESPDYHPVSFEVFCDEHLAGPDLHHPSSRIAKVAGQPAGFVLCRLSETRGYIDLLAVKHEFRRREIGRALLRHALHTLAASGAQETRLDVASDNPGALRLYRGAGMTDRHEILVYEKAGSARR